MARKEFIEQTYQAFIKFYGGAISRLEAVRELTENGMNSGSAIINLNVLRHIMNGDEFTRTLNASSFEYFFDRISNDFSRGQLLVSLDSLGKHIKYLEGKRNYKMGLVGDIYNKYLALTKLPVSEQNEDEEEESFPEGKEKYKLHRLKERNKKLVELAKKNHKDKDPKMRCQVCEFSFLEIYGKWGEDFIEAHHVFPISELKKESPTRIEDLALVCSNCHRMLHRKRPWLNISSLRDLLN